MRRSRDIYDKRLARLSGLSAVLFAAACAGDTPKSPNVSIGAVTTLESPAGPGSGEPFLAPGSGRVYLSWLEEREGGRHDLRLARYEEDVWSEPAVVRSSDRFFVNWADFPSVTPAPDGTIWAHWLERGDAGGYDYGVRVVRSGDGGRTWSEPWKPHEDDTPTEHGFVSMWPMEKGVGLAWLDGRQFVEGTDGSAATSEMTLRFRTAAAHGDPGPETLVDARVCDCCQTDAAMTSEGPVLVYRDRSPAEIRDIYVTRLVDGVWTEGRPVHDDGWEIAGCPVNGPAVAARGRTVAVAWFSAPDDEARVKVAFSQDAGATFGPPVVVDDGSPAGRVDVLLLGDGTALVSWLERTGGEGAEVRVRTVGPDGAVSGSVGLAASSAARASGFPRMAALPGGDVMIAWTDVAEARGRVQVARIEVDGS